VRDQSACELSLAQYRKPADRVAQSAADKNVRSKVRAKGHPGYANRACEQVSRIWNPLVITVAQRDDSGYSEGAPVWPDGKE
jgi:hypothetical protein